jgi:hypothetical protein
MAPTRRLKATGPRAGRILPALIHKVSGISQHLPDNAKFKSGRRDADPAHRALPPCI